MGGSDGKGRKDGSVPGQGIVGISGPLYDVLFGRWQIFWRLRPNEAGKLEVNFIVRVPQAAPRPPYTSEVMQIYGRVCNHVKSEPEFVSTRSWWSHWVLALTSKVSRVQPLLLTPSPQCGCDPWLDSRTSREVYEGLCEWLKGLDKVPDIRTH